MIVPNVTVRDIKTLTDTVWMEARGETREGQIAVIWAIINRVNSDIWPNTITEVCLQPYQFSAWNTNNRGRTKLAFVDVTDDTYARIYALVIGVLVGDIPDPTNGATHYFNPKVARPKWADKLEYIGDFDNHSFYKLTM